MTTGKGQRDNSTLQDKINLRRLALAQLEEKLRIPAVVMESNGGYGEIYKRCYADYLTGVVFEKSGERAEALAKQRPGWAVYEADCVAAIKAGVGSHLEVNFLDCDPYGEIWHIVDAFFQSDRPRPQHMVVVVNDNLRASVQINKGWSIASLQDVVQKYGNAEVYKHYLPISKEMLAEKAGRHGYQVRGWHGYHLGRKATHWAAVLAR